jgi:hypothetical protein
VDCGALLGFLPGNRLPELDCCRKASSRPGPPFPAAWSAHSSSHSERRSRSATFPFLRASGPFTCAGKTRLGDSIPRNSVDSRWPIRGMQRLPHVLKTLCYGRGKAARAAGSKLRPSVWKPEAAPGLGLLLLSCRMRTWQCSILSSRDSASVDFKSSTTDRPSPQGCSRTVGCARRTPPNRMDGTWLTEPCVADARKSVEHYSCALLRERPPMVYLTPGVSASPGPGAFAEGMRTEAESLGGSGYTKLPRLTRPCIGCTMENAGGPAIFLKRWGASYLDWNVRGDSKRP